MRTSDFDYELPRDHIAQRPAEPRTSSRLMILERSTGQIEHRRFRDLPEVLSSKDALILNETRVIRARLSASKLPDGGKAELLLLERRGAMLWEVWVGGKRISPGRQLELAGGLRCEVLEDLGGPKRLVRFDSPITPMLSEIGIPPIPPYIQEPLRSADEYQTVYARHPGSAAAPTAGLHFTDDLLADIRGRGVTIAAVTLHIGLDTFAPVTVERPGEHPIHSEWCRVPDEAIGAVRHARGAGGRVVAVGTTTVRALESAAGQATPEEILRAYEGPTDLFVLPGFEFRVVDAMLTNFHLPRSTLLMMVSAFAGRGFILEAYQVAISEGYRFYSFGDAMLIV
ncbi:MAG: tRNA preQ1(34) S-adenosylmethionine ribosyltransferase-isomerase QueA [Chloroflexi bacterium]|nr:tRNA preQ1(34) S-adenosylmethionine ribosyltransferase-isomerase QueA [Chloroflexota bacterium]